jgi:hypothetical protein
MDGSEQKAKVVDGSNPHGLSAAAKQRIRAGFAETDRAAGVPLGPNGESIGNTGTAERIAYFNRLISRPDGPVGQ